MKVKKVLGVMVASLCALSMLAACGGGGQTPVVQQK